MQEQEKFGLVFAGGNGNLAFQIGAWQAIVEAGLHGCVTATAGTSLGALNALLFALDALELAERIWLERVPVHIQNPSRQKLEEIYSLLQMSGLHALSLDLFLDRMQHGVLSIASMEQVVYGMDFTRVGLVQNCFLALTRLPEGEEATVDVLDYPAKMRRAMLFTAMSLPLLSTAMRFPDGRVYWDGVLTQLLPINAIYEEAGLRRIVILHAVPMCEVKKKDYPDAKIIEVSPPMEENDLPGCLDFTKQTLERRIALGRRAMQEQIEKNMLV